MVARMEAPGPRRRRSDRQCNASCRRTRSLEFVTVLGASSTAHEAPPFAVPMMLGESRPEAKLLAA